MSDETDSSVCHETFSQRTRDLDHESLASTRPMLGKATESSNVHAYNMTHPERGDFIIINNKRFDPRTEQEDRQGTEVDAENLCERFTELGFSVIVYNNLTCIQMLKVLVEAAKKDHSNADCFGCAILSHGDEGVVYGVDGQIQIDYLVEPFKGNRCNSLLGKPKIFIIQACRGDMLDAGSVFQSDDVRKDEKVYRVPAEADFLYAYSTVAGYYSFRNKRRGSWFIQALCTMLGRYGHSKDIMSILTRVNYEVAYNYESRSSKDEINKMKQMPSIVSMLTKDLVFHSK